MGHFILRHDLHADHGRMLYIQPLSAIRDETFQRGFTQREPSVHNLHRRLLCRQLRWRAYAAENHCQADPRRRLYSHGPWLAAHRHPSLGHVLGDVHHLWRSLWHRRRHRLQCHRLSDAQVVCGQKGAGLGTDAGDAGTFGHSIQPHRESVAEKLRLFKILYGGGDGICRGGNLRHPDDEKSAQRLYVRLHGDGSHRYHEEAV